MNSFDCFCFFLEKIITHVQTDDKAGRKQIGDGKALEYICSKINDLKFVKKLSLRGQGISDEGVKKIVDTLKNNHSIEKLYLSLSFNFFSNLFSFDKNKNKN